jgi:hypothetical protein
MGSFGRKGSATLERRRTVRPERKQRRNRLPGRNMPTKSGQGPIAGVPPNDTKSVLI